jgi:competence protein ComEC
MAQIHFLNVGDGDCTWIRHSNEANTIIDVCLAKSDNLIKAQDAVTEMFSTIAKPNTIRGNYNQAANSENPIQYLQKFGTNSVFRFILSHPDMDHMDGIEDFFKTFHPINFWDTKNNKVKPDFGESSKYSEKDWDFYQSIKDSESSPKYLYLYDGSKGKYYNQNEDGTNGGNGLFVLSPTPQLIKEANNNGDYNDCSYVILYRIGKFKVLFCGDASNKTFEHLLANHLTDISDVDLLIAPHHGRKGNIDFSFLDVMRPTMTFFGNANSEHLAYQEWSGRKLEKITNNQAGSLIVTFESNDGMSIYARHEAFARNYRVDTHRNIKLDAWYLKTIYK